MRYDQKRSGEWVRVGRAHRIACCDCGLVHDLRFRGEGRSLEMSATLRERSTAARRRGRAVREKLLGLSIKVLLSLSGGGKKGRKGGAETP